ncbi:hypothetical protein [Actinocorallia populi]|uniref:hypothetical protein n=1 Tax=Actinocorallia populi TaxID=2079200 RepID=UPI0018E52EE2|nr:hypothetical protein [Actinocorallia populi]
MKQEKRSFADRRAEEGAPLEDEVPDLAEEHTPGPTDPPIAPADGPGGEDEGYEPQTRV